MRIYSVPFANTSVSAVQDLIGLYCGASMAVELHGITIGQITSSTVANLRISVKRLAATVTAGTGGAAVTPVKAERGDAAATATARRNDTVQASSSGATDVILADVFNVINGYQFFWPLQDRPSAGLSEAFILSLDTAPGSAMSMSGTLIFAERI